MTKPKYGMCAQRRLRLAWASAQSDQFSLCAQWVAKDPSFLHADSEDPDQTGWSDQFSLCAQWVAKDPSFLHADSEDPDQTGWMPRLIWLR